MIHCSDIIFGVSCSNVTPYAFQIVWELETFYLASTQYGNSSPESQVTAVFSHKNIAVRAYKARLDFGVKPGLRDETNVYVIST